MKSPGWIKVGAVATVCALAGAGAGIAGSTAATSNSAKKSGKTRTAAAERHRGPFGPGLRHGPAVHAEAVVLDRAGKAYITVTSDSGIVKSVSGKELTITEGTTAVPYKDVTVTVPDGATIVRNGAKATLADLKAGDHVRVSRSSDGTTVFAGDESVGPGQGGRHGFGDRGGRGHRGPPPGMPGMP